LLNKNKEISVYVHWPYCLKKCPYCDFNSHVSKQEIDYKDWALAYKNEINIEQNRLGKKDVSSIFFGGGTPSLMPPNLVESIINSIGKKWNITNKTEITVEANPSSVEINNFKYHAESGVNRLSLGFQSLNDDHLKFLGRNHKAKDSLRALEIAKKNFDRVSFDLIYGLPDQTEFSWKQELKEAIKFSGEHMSAYQLTIEKGTPFYSMHRDKSFILPSETTLLNLYKITDELLKDAKLEKYEVSNYSLQNAESIHNVKIWKGFEYCGIGPGAHGRVKINNKWFATHRYSSPTIWLSKNLSGNTTLYKNEEICHKERAQEVLLTGLRLTKGIKIKELFDNASITTLDAFINMTNLSELQKLGLININTSTLKITSKGLPVLNTVINKLLI
jgi:putative oxygen-independent coproporphyrinogen III oxidase